MIRHMRGKGCYLRDIAAAVGVSEKTVGRALKRSGAPPKRKAGVRKSKLDPFKPQIDGLLADQVWNAEVIFAELREAGYRGGVTLIRDYVRPKRPLRQSRETVRFETEPGRQLQHDWGEIETVIAGQRRRVSFAVNTLGYSRRFHVWATDSQDAEHTYESLVRSFTYFGGVTGEVLVDNQKAAVLEHGSAGPVFNEGFVCLADHYGFVPRACKPYRARTKGKDERNVRYVKENFFQRHRAFDSLEHLNQLLLQWLAEVADPRVHGTVKEVVSERFAREAPQLKALPRTPFDTSYIEQRRVAFDGYIDVRGNRYSVPTSLCGSVVTIRIGLDDVLKVFDGDRLLARHRLVPANRGWQTVPAHHAALWAETCAVEVRDLRQYEEVA